MKKLIYVALSTVALSCSLEGEFPAEDDAMIAVASEDFSLRGGGAVSTGSLEAVVQLNGCSGTLITNTTVLTAAHCVCGTTCSSDSTCAERSRATFTNVRRVGSSSRENVSIGADVVVHPGYCETGWLRNDYAILKLDRPANEVVQVSPLEVEAKPMSVGEAATLVGYGRTHSGSSDNCDQSGAGVKRSGTTVLDEYLKYSETGGGATLVFNDNGVGACPGDSGGPALNSSGRVVGVASSGNSSTNSNYDSSSVAWGWLQRNACPDMSASDYDPGFCDNPLCPCAPQEGDCDSDSQCTAGSKCTWDIGKAARLPGHYDVCWRSDQLATFFASTNYGGKKQDFPQGNWGVTELTRIGNDAVSSLAVPAGMTARLCTENGYWGNCQEFSGAVSLAGNSLNNKTSSIQVFSGVTVYSSKNYGGRRQTFREGVHGVGAFSTIKNDDISSLIASPGMFVRICSENGAWGDCDVYGGRVSDVGSTMNNKASSVEVYRGVTLYDGVNFGGKVQSLRVGEYGVAQLSIGNDRISSLVVAPGLSVEICSENGGWGDCETFTGWVDYIGDALDNRGSFVRVKTGL